MGLFLAECFTFEQGSIFIFRNGDRYSFCHIIFFTFCSISGSIFIIQKPTLYPWVAHVVNKVFAKVSKKISKVNKSLGCYAFSFIVCAFSSSSSFLRFVYCASYALICDVIFKPPFYLPYGPFLKRKSDQNKNPADPPLTATSISPLLSFKN